jgi:hypothetical protein
VKYLAGDQAQLSFYSEDNLGNKEALQTIGGKASDVETENIKPDQNVIFEFYVDKDPPVAALETNSDIYQGNYIYISPRTKFTLTAEDKKAGVEKIEYSINSTSIDILYKNPFSIEKKGLHYLRFKATDYVGNTSTPLVKTYYCDPDAPKSTINIGNPKFLSRDTLFISSKTPISITAKDEGSGLAIIKYTVNNSEPIEYSKSFKLDQNGFAEVQYQAEDKVNNREELNTQKFYVDNELPIIHHHFSVESIGSKVVRDENYTIYPTNVMLYIAVTDKHSGGDKIEYCINGGSLQTDNPVKSLKPGNYLINVSAYDVLGNKSLKEIKFSVE